MWGPAGSMLEDPSPKGEQGLAPRIFQMLFSEIQRVSYAFEYITQAFCLIMRAMMDGSSNKHQTFANYLGEDQVWRKRSKLSVPLFFS